MSGDFVSMTLEADNDRSFLIDQIKKFKSYMSSDKNSSCDETINSVRSNSKQKKLLNERIFIYQKMCDNFELYKTKSDKEIFDSLIKEYKNIAESSTNESDIHQEGLAVGGKKKSNKKRRTAKKSRKARKSRRIKK